MTSSSLAKSDSIEGIQYLRGIAALMVVLFHSRSYFTDIAAWTGVGARGVDLFFVISGFIMAHSTRHIGRDASMLRESGLFLAKRIIRIVPLYWIALLWTSAPYWFYWFTHSNSMAEMYVNNSTGITAIIKDFFFIPHYSLDEEEEGEIFPILIQGWTLNYEMFFYCLFAITLFFRSYRLHVASFVLITLVLIGKLVSFTSVAGLIYTASILVEFVFGMMVFYVFTKTQHLSFDRMTLVVFGIVGFLLLNRGSLVNDKFVLAVAASIIVLVFIHGFRGVQVRALKILGDASYSIYLFHPAAFGLTRWFIGSIGFSREGLYHIITIVMLQVVMAIIVGIAIYYFIEKPILNVLRKGLDRLTSSSARTATDGQKGLAQ